MKYLLTTLTTIMAFGLLAVSMPVFAQTPDGIVVKNMTVKVSDLLKNQVNRSN